MYIHAKVGDGGASGTGESAAGRMVARPQKAARRGSMEGISAGTGECVAGCDGFQILDCAST